MGEIPPDSNFVFRLEVVDFEQGDVTDEENLRYADWYKEVLREGDGPHPSFGNLLTIDYELTYPNGTIFNSTYANGAPHTFRYENKLMKCIERALIDSRIGEKSYVICSKSTAVPKTENVRTYKPVPMQMTLEILDFDTSIE